MGERGQGVVRPGEGLAQPRREPGRVGQRQPACERVVAVGHGERVVRRRGLPLGSVGSAAAVTDERLQHLHQARVFERVEVTQGHADAHGLCVLVHVQPRLDGPGGDVDVGAVVVEGGRGRRHRVGTGQGPGERGVGLAHLGMGEHVRSQCRQGLRPAQAGVHGARGVSERAHGGEDEGGVGLLHGDFLSGVDGGHMSPEDGAGAPGRGWLQM